MSNKPFAPAAIAEIQSKELEGCTSDYMIRATLAEFIFKLKVYHPKAYECVLECFGLTKDDVR